MKINEVVKQYDITRKALLVYEKKGLIQPARDQSGYRDYSEKDLKIIAKIILLRKFNIPLDDITKILSGNQQWINDMEELYQLEIKRLEVKHSYLHYVNDVINDCFDANEAIYSLDESLKYEENNESKQFEIKPILTFIIILFAILLALYTYDLYLIIATFVVVVSIILVSLLETHFYNYSSIISKLISYMIFVSGCLGIYCFFYTKEMLIYKLLLIFSFFVILYSFSKQEYLKRLYDVFNSRQINILIVISISTPVIMTVLKDMKIIHVTNKLTFFICSLSLVLASVATAIKHDRK